MVAEHKVGACADLQFCVFAHKGSGLSFLLDFGKGFVHFVSLCATSLEEASLSKSLHSDFSWSWPVHNFLSGSFPSLRHLFRLQTNIVYGRKTLFFFFIANRRKLTMTS